MASGQNKAPRVARWGHMWTSSDVEAAQLLPLQQRLRITGTTKMPKQSTSRMPPLSQARHLIFTKCVHSHPSYVFLYAWSIRGNTTTWLMKLDDWPRWVHSLNVNRPLASRSRLKLVSQVETHLRISVRAVWQISSDSMFPKSFRKLRAQSGVFHS